MLFRTPNAIYRENEKKSKEQNVIIYLGLFLDTLYLYSGV
jgi:hypothetical protein